MQEPSTHAGLAAAAQALAFFFPQYAPVFNIITMLFGGAAIATPENKPAAAATLPEVLG